MPRPPEPCGPETRRPCPRTDKNKQSVSQPARLRRCHRLPGGRLRGVACLPGSASLVGPGASMRSADRCANQPCKPHRQFRTKSGLGSKSAPPPAVHSLPICATMHQRPGRPEPAQRIRKAGHCSPRTARRRPLPIRKAEPTPAGPSRRQIMKDKRPDHTEAAQPPRRCNHLGSEPTKSTFRDGSGKLDARAGAQTR